MARCRQWRIISDCYDRASWWQRVRSAPLIAISTDRQTEARAALLALGLEEDRDSAAERLVFRMGRLTAAQINRSLVEEGFAVSALAQESRGLERLYRDKLGSQPSFEAHSVQENRP